MGADIRDMPHGVTPDAFLKEVLRVPGDYVPREYYKKKDQPPTAFDVLDDFADSIVGAIKK